VGAQGSALTEAIEWFLDHLKVERGASAHTVLAYHGDLSRAVAFYSARGLESWADLGAADLIAFEATLAPPMARSTAQRRITALRSFLKFLKRNQAGPEAELPSTGGFRKPKTLPKALGLLQLQAMLDLADIKMPEGLRDRALMELIYGAGLRVTEAVTLDTSALDLDHDQLRVVGKRGKTRVVPLPAQTAQWLRRYLDDGRPTLLKGASGLVILSDRGKPLLRQTAYDRIERYARLAGLEGVSPHTLRHTYAVHLVRGGADLRVVQELLGHESVATTQVYTQLDLAEVRAKYRSAHPRD